jgi:hypothetical protein
VIGRFDEFNSHQRTVPPGPEITLDHFAIAASAASLFVEGQLHQPVTDVLRATLLASESIDAKAHDQQPDRATDDQGRLLALLLDGVQLRPHHWGNDQDARGD